MHSNKTIPVALSTIVILLMAGLITIALFAGCTPTGSPSGEAGLSAQEAVAALDRSDEITIKKDFYNFGDHWSVYAETEKVADIEGELIRIWDCYVMRSTNGEFICAEQEQFALITARSAKLDESGNEIGRYDQNISLLLLSTEYRDKDGELIATLKQNLGLTLDCSILNAEEQESWKAKKTLFQFGPEIVLTRKDAEPMVPAVDAIMMSAVANELTEKSNDH